MEIRIATLGENTAGHGFIGEWGLSILIETDDARVLLDTGRSFSATYNAQLMGVDLSTVTHIVLSHGHGDHTGGLKEVLHRSGMGDDIDRAAVWEAKYVVFGETPPRYTGIPFRREQLENLGGRFQLSREPVWITNDIVTSGEVPLTTDYEEVDPHLFVKEGETLRPDTVPDDLSLAVKTDLGLVVVLGCAHRGMINTIRHFQQITSTESVYCVIGGTHLLFASGERLALTVADLRETGIRRLGVSHCTGFGASAWLAREFPDEFFVNSAGNHLTFS